MSRWLERATSIPARAGPYGVLGLVGLGGLFAGVTDRFERIVAADKA